MEKAEEIDKENAPFLKKSYSAPTLERITDPDKKIACANSIVRKGAEHDLRGNFDDMLTAVDHYMIAFESADHDSSLLNIYITGLVNLREFAEKEDRSSDIIRGIEENIAYAQKRMQDDFHVDHQIKHS